VRYLAVLCELLQLSAAWGVIPKPGILTTAYSATRVRLRGSLFLRFSCPFLRPRPNGQLVRGENAALRRRIVRISQAETHGQLLGHEVPRLLSGDVPRLWWPPGRPADLHLATLAAHLDLARNEDMIYSAESTNWCVAEVLERPLSGRRRPREPSHSAAKTPLQYSSPVP
jgi:hypothetical protein